RAPHTSRNSIACYLCQASMPPSLLLPSRWLLDRECKCTHSPALSYALVHRHTHTHTHTPTLCAHAPHCHARSARAPRPPPRDTAKEHSLMSTMQTWRKHTHTHTRQRHTLS